MWVARIFVALMFFGVSTSAFAGIVFTDSQHPVTQSLLNDTAFTGNPANFANPKADSRVYRMDIECSPKKDDTFGKILDPQKVNPSDFNCWARPAVGFTRAPAGVSSSAWTPDFNLKHLILKILVNKTDFMYMAGNYTIFIATVTCNRAVAQPFCEFQSR